MVLIANIRTDLSRINLNVHEYNMDSDAKLSITPYYAMSSPSDTPSLSACGYTVFIDVVIKTKSTSEAVVKA